ncbi:hypothetical protein OOZ19_18920 [Saccharopolyspora sp. NFXS83]|nr:hypothetical protein [Saccharopolyspora sp. NFXS83]MCX2732316.1 hypothetical protein [Saccharopolyspora sp. NFXS83]
MGVPAQDHARPPSGGERPDQPFRLDQANRVEQVAADLEGRVVHRDDQQARFRRSLVQQFQALLGQEAVILTRHHGIGQQQACRAVARHAGDRLVRLGEAEQGPHRATAVVIARDHQGVYPGEQLVLLDRPVLGDVAGDQDQVGLRVQRPDVLQSPLDPGTGPRRTVEVQV